MLKRLSFLLMVEATLEPRPELNVMLFDSGSERFAAAFCESDRCDTTDDASDESPALPGLLALQSSAGGAQQPPPPSRTQCTDLELLRRAAAVPFRGATATCNCWCGPPF